LSLQESYDNAGLIVGDSNTVVTSVLVCLDSVEESIDEAIALGANLIVAHHPIVFRGLKRFNGKNYVERTVIKAIKNDVAIYAIHTNLDNVPNGVNSIIAKKLGLKKIRVLSPQPEGLKKLITFVPESYSQKVRLAVLDAGAGKIGNYSHCSFSSTGKGTFKANENAKPFVGKLGEIHTEKEVRIEVVFPVHIQGQVLKALKSAHPYEEVAYDIYLLDNLNPEIGAGAIGELEKEMDSKVFLHQIKDTMKAGMMRFTQLHKKQIKTVAICGGSGSFLLSAAKRAKADLFLTSDFKYHEFFDAENQIIIADIGHYESEQYTKELLADFLTQKFSTFAVRISEINTNPVNYL
jgi:dinuclear metal center YbgI/SA1388 family protein